MQEKTAIHLTHLFDLGYKIKIEAGAYETGWVTSIGRLDYDDDNSPYVYSDEFHEDRELEEVSVTEVRVYAFANWLHPNFGPNEQDEESLNQNENLFLRKNMSLADEISEQEDDEPDFEDDDIIEVADNSLEKKSEVQNIILKELQEVINDADEDLAIEVYNVIINNEGVLYQYLRHDRPLQSILDEYKDQFLVEDQIKLKIF